MDPVDGHFVQRISFDKWTKNLLVDIGRAKADWFRFNNWPSHLNRFLRHGLTHEEAWHFQQFLGVCGEAALWQWLWGDLSEFWKQQAFLHESKALSDGGEDLPGLDVKTRDLMYHGTVSQPDLLLTQNRLNPKVHYVLCVVELDKPVVPLELNVSIMGCISGQVVVDRQQEWWDEKLKKVVVPQEFLSPPETLLWHEHKINKGKA